MHYSNPMMLSSMTIHCIASHQAGKPRFNFHCQNDLKNCIQGKMVRHKIMIISRDVAEQFSFLVIMLEFWSLCQSLKFKSRQLTSLFYPKKICISAKMPNFKTCMSGVGEPSFFLSDIPTTKYSIICCLAGLSNFLVG